MKSAILLLALTTAAFTSCTTAYKTGQTPDDVYFSPARPQDEYVQTEKEDDRQYSYSDEYYDDRYLRMKVRNRYRWNDLNDWYYYERYGFGHNYYYGSYYNPYNSWNYYYNPYCCCYGNNHYSNPKNISYTPPVKPHSFNLAGYTNSNYNTGNAKSAKTSGIHPVYNNSNNNSNSNNGKGLSNTIRNILRSNDNSNSGSSGSSGNSGSRTYNPSSSSSSNNSSSSSSSGSSSSGSVSRPGRN